jgi:hypothetical protein
MKIAFLYIGGIHQVFHTAAVAAELSKVPGVDVHCLCASDEIRSTVERITTGFAAEDIAFSMFEVPKIVQRAFLPLQLQIGHKYLRLFSNRKFLSTFDCIVTPERTSSVLKRWLGERTKLIHFRHGAGDGQRGFEDRISLFDYVFVSGPKDAERLAEEGLVAEEKCAAIGSVKLATIARLDERRNPLFTNGKPTVLYNPHFKPKLGSWHSWGHDILTWFRQQEQYNLIFAPHIRLFENHTEQALQDLKSASIPGRIIVDTGSVACCDMTYANAADIYLGDVSSQAYELLCTPRPCIFLNAHGVNWQNDKNYRFWQFGDVVSNFANFESTLASANPRHATVYEALQKAAAKSALGEEWASAPALAAATIMNFMRSTEFAAVAA